MTKNGQKPRNTDEATPAHSQDLKAEMALLGSIMLDSDCIDDIALLVNPEDFYLETHGAIFRAMLDLHNQVAKVDAVTVLDALTKAGKARGVTVEVLIELMAFVPHAGHAAFHARIVAEKSAKRALIYAGTDFIKDGYDESLESDEAIGIASARIAGLLEQRCHGDQKSIKEILLETMDQIEAGKARGIMTGFAGLDALTNGLQNSHVIILGARTSMGKSALAGNIMANLAYCGVPVLMLSLEMPPVEIAERLLSSWTEIPMNRLSRGDLLEDYERDKILEAAGEMSKLPIWPNDCRNERTITQLETRARLMKRKHGIKLVIVDYLQLIRPSKRHSNREQEVAEVSGRMKGLAAQLEVPIIVMAQINREAAKGDDKRPQIYQLRDSGAIEQDADEVLLLHRPHYYDTSKPCDEAELTVAKQRNGPRGTVKLKWNQATMTFSNPDMPEDPYSDPQQMIPFEPAQPLIETGRF